MAEQELDPVEILRSMRRTLRGLVIATAVLFILFGGVVFYVWTNAEQNHSALCALRADLEERVADSVDFLVEHPEGAFGFTPAEIQDGIDNQTRTIKALDTLSCG